MEESRNEKIERFLTGKMSAKEVMSFEKLMKEDEDLREEVAIYKRMHEHFTDKATQDSSDYEKILQSKMKSEEGQQAEAILLEVQNEYLQENNAIVKPKSNLLKLFVYSSVAAAVIIISVFVFMQEQTSQDLYSQYYVEADLPSFSKRSDVQTSLLNLGVEKFNASEYEAASDYFEQYLQSDTNINPLTYIYAGLVASELGNLKEAIDQFELLENLNIEDSSRALWYKALIYLKFDQRDQAETILKLIVENPANYKYQKAKELLPKL